MDQAKKAALFNALLFPGCGQFYLKRYGRGLAFLLPVLAGTLFLAWRVISVGLSLIKASPFKKGTVQFANILQVTLDALRNIDYFSFLLLALPIVLLWILSIADAYALGKKIFTTDGHPESVSDRR
jgi:TM2 domain-containing membrane protein YozV